MQYVFKFGPEAIWFILVTVVTAVLQLVVDQGATRPTDIGVWLISLGAAAIRALLGALMHVLSSPSNPPA